MMQPERATRADHEPPEALRVRLLGGFSVSVGPRTVEEDRWRLRKAAALVKVLALAPHHRMRRERLMSLLWPDLPLDAASNNLHRTLYDARRALDPETPAANSPYLRLRGDLLELNPEGSLWVDAEAFEEAAERARRSGDPAAYRAALDLYAGELLPADRYEAWAEERREALRQTRLSMLARLPEMRETPKPHERPGEGTAGDRRHNLSVPRTSFVGRERELVEVKRELSITRLLTLTGAGGSGKTRLALEVARDLVGTYPDGVWLVELAPLSDPGLVSREVAEALRVREQPHRPLTATLTDSLRTKDLLLVLDNCEHLTEACAGLVFTLLSSCERLRILATSREALGVRDEISRLVLPLSLPDRRSSPTVEELLGCESVRLFVERARSRMPAFELTPENAGAVAEVCRRLDGIPLAIELATARITALTVEQIAERLEDSLKLLTSGGRTAEPRQRTLRATLEWSYGLLSEPERALFRRLSVFAGGWTLPAAEAVGEDHDARRKGRVSNPPVPDLLGRLVEKSMVVAEADVEASHAASLRYTILEPVRQYGQERLEASGEAEVIRRRHAFWYFDLAREVEPWLRGARQQVWLEQLEKEYGNLRAALGWALDSKEADLGLWFAGALGEFWYLSGNLSEGRRWLEAALASSTEAAPTPARVRALARAGWIAWEQGDYGRSVALSQESLALARRLDDRAGAVAALSNLGWAALLGDDLDRASELAGEAVTLARALEDAGGVARALLILGLAAVAAGDHERALELHEESLALAREAQDGTAMILSLVMGTFACLGRDDLLRAKTLCRESLALAQRPRVIHATALKLCASAALAGSQKLPTRSARLWGAAESLRETIGATLSPVEHRVYEPYIGAARKMLDETAWEEAWSEGKAMTFEEAVSYALVEGEERRPARPLRPSETEEEPPAGGQPLDALTRREREVALLLARGLTNRRIAQELSISERTVTTHVDHILAKLGATSRAQVAAWVVERRPLREETRSG